MISDDSSGSPRPSIQELGRALSAQMAAQIQKMAAARGPGQGQGQGQPSVPSSSAPPILQSSSLPAKNLTPQSPRKGVRSSPVTHATPSPAVTKAVHQLPGRIIKMTSGLPAVSGRSAGSARRSSQSHPGPVAMDTSPGGSGEQEKLSAGDATGQSAGLSVTAVATDSEGCKLVPMNLVRVSPSAKRDSPGAEERLAAGAGQSPTSVTKDSNPAEAQKAGSPESVARAVLMHSLMMKAMTEKHNGGCAHPEGISEPGLAGVLPLGLTAAAGSSPTGGPRHAPLLGTARVTPLPTPTSSVVTSPAISSVGQASLLSTATPSAAHSQHTRPLLVVRSASLHAGSADGRPTGSVELRHVTADALLALQQSSSNSVKPANQNPARHSLKSVPLTFEQQMRSCLMAGGVGGGVAMETDGLPPLSNHVTQERARDRQRHYDPDGDWDEPRDLSLKPRRTESKAEGDFGAKWSLWGSASPPAGPALGKADRSKDVATSEKRHKAGSSQSRQGRSQSRQGQSQSREGQSKPTSRKQQRAKGSKTQPAAVRAVGGADKHSAGPGWLAESRVVTEGSEEKPDVGEGRAVAGSESKPAACERDSRVGTAVVEMTGSVTGGEREKLTPAKQSLYVPQDKHVPTTQHLQTNPPLALSVPGGASLVQGKTAPVEGKTAPVERKTAPTVEARSTPVIVSQGCRRPYAKDKSDQNDNVDDSFPGLPVMENQSSDAEGSAGNSTLQDNAQIEAMETE